MMLASERFRMHVMSHDSPNSDDSRPQYSSEDEARTRQFLTEATEFGPARRLRSPVTIGDTPMHWDRPAVKLGSSAPAW
jgi:hypothetical protein